MKRLRRFLERKLNDLNVSRKLLLIYIFCVILPLALTDGVILFMLSVQQERERKADVEAVCNAVESELRYTFDGAINVTNGLYTNLHLHEFLVKGYNDDLEYYEAWTEFSNTIPMALLRGQTVENISFYTANETLTDGGNVFRLNKKTLENWQNIVGMKESSVKDMPVSSLYFYYVGSSEPTATKRRRVTYFRRLVFFKDSKIDQVAAVSLDYNTLVERLENMNLGYPVMICEGDRILYSNMAYTNNNTQDYYHLTGEEKVLQERDITLYGLNLRILCLDDGVNALEENVVKILPWILLLVATNLVMPILMGGLIRSSFVDRLRLLGATFEQSQADNLVEVTSVSGKDEIGVLTDNYNYMARRINELIRTIYTDRLEKQEIDLERKHAELLALQSQINPHFLFNVLEGIRMHCVINGETDTAKMVSSLAVLVRQNVDWDADYITIEGEGEFIRAYLDLQKYRFGDRFHYEIDLDPEVKGYRIPKLTLVTFVENSCVHGIENKASDCWLYVRAYEKNDMLVLEVEDTGTGMEDEKVVSMKDMMINCTLDDLKTHHHVGITNACLRLHMMTKHETQFEIESEMGVGTFFTIYIPKKYAVGSIREEIREK